MAPAFSSRREKRLWVWTAAVVVAIYSTLGVTGALAGQVGGDLLGAMLFVAGMVLVAGTIALQALRTRPGGAELGVALGVIAAYLMVFVRVSSPVERSHLIEYGVVAAFAYEALLERARQGRRVVRPGLLAILLTALLGSLDELIQAVLPSRVFDPVDMLFNTVAAAMSVSASMVLRWARRRRSRTR